MTDGVGWVGGCHAGVDEYNNMLTININNEYTGWFETEFHICFILNILEINEWMRRKEYNRK